MTAQLDEYRVRSPGQGFPATSWSLVLKAAEHPAPESKQALASLCAAYFYPTFVYVRRICQDPEEARDLTQEFFLRVLEKGYLRQACRDRGSFRAFLMACLRHFLSNEWDRTNAQKRGGGCSFIAVDFSTAETRYGLEAWDDLTPDKVFEKRWALEVLRRVLGRLRDEYEKRSQAVQFETLKPFLTGDQDQGAYGQAAASLQVSEAAARVAVHRIRRRYADLLRHEIAQTVSGPDEVDSEIHFLLNSLAAK